MLRPWKKDDAKAMYFISSTIEPAHVKKHSDMQIEPRDEDEASSDA